MTDFAETKELNVPGAKISYLKSGAGPALVMIHGIMSNSIDFGFQFEEFSDRYTCIAPDIRGCGRSTADDPRNVTIADAADDVLAVANAELGADASFIVAGHSFGGIIAFDMLSRYPQRIEAIIAVSTPVMLGSNILLKPLVPLLSLLLPVAAPLIENEALLNFYTLTLNMSSKNVTGATRRLLSQRNRHVDKSDLAVTSALMSSVMRWELSDMPVEGLPALLVYGDRDMMFTGRDARAVAGKYPGVETVIIKGTRHSPMNEKPADFNEVVCDFLERNNDDVL